MLDGGWWLFQVFFKLQFDDVKKWDWQKSSVGFSSGHSDEYEDFLEVKNQKPKIDSFPYKFTVCISTMFDFTNVLQVMSQNRTTTVFHSILP